MHCKSFKRRYKKIDEIRPSMKYTLVQEVQVKIIYLTDIHDALKDLRRLLDSTEAELYLLSGDILYKAFYEEEKIYNFVCLQEEFYQLAREFSQDIYPMDLALEILRFPDKYASEHLNADRLAQKAEEYRKLFEMAAKTMKEKYSLIRELIDKFAQAPTWVLPGNYDIDLRYTDLEEYNLHTQIKYKRSLKFAGYGGAPIQTPGIPEKLALRYHETTKKGQLYSEPLSFFKGARADILVLHNPAYGYFDCIPSLGHVGSQGVRAYLDEHEPLLVLSGHVHEDYGAARSKNTIYLNPSNFGGVESVQGWQPGGSYAEIYIKDKQIANIVFMQLKEDHICPLMRVYNTEKGLLGELDRSHKNHSHIDLNLLIRDNAGLALA